LRESARTLTGGRLGCCGLSLDESERHGLSLMVHLLMSSDNYIGFYGKSILLFEFFHEAEDCTVPADYESIRR
jgi:hypothetical protein